MIGQIVYNIEDFSGSGGFISSRPVPEEGRICSSDSSIDYDNDKIKIIENNVFEVYGSHFTATKLGIQAPPGTKFVINGNLSEEADNSDFPKVNIMVGRTGVYEIDNVLPIRSLEFERPKEYFLDTYTSNILMNQGRAQMTKAKDDFDIHYQTLLNNLGSSAIYSESNSEFQEEVNRIVEEFYEDYTSGRAKYLQGMTGVYKSENSINTQDLYNIIIDYVFTTIES